MSHSSSGCFSLNSVDVYDYRMDLSTSIVEQSNQQHRDLCLDFFPVLFWPRVQPLALLSQTCTIETYSMNRIAHTKFTLLALGW